MAKEEDNPLGFRLPLYRSLTEQILIVGAPKSVIVVNGMVMAIFILSLHSFWIIPLNIIIHFGAIFLTKLDDQIFDCLLKYIRNKNYYCT
jgi:type IV secretion system protein TrbD